ncbi:MAG: hypothetical protein KKE44_09530 [Proteobacteria bacterium]|nr:hypothetical protein [Pseudomonadota bacterium]MBU1582965.1 hypothetical protein [Pseudomonadota bacterium]MBU2454278.1 hypothetical protein [Pseudomonadota bacterium]MBU2631352.1 hypothetical protein [Pseudomonadota bacterium]
MTARVLIALQAYEKTYDLSSVSLFMELVFDSFNTSISSLFESIIEFIQLKVKGILQLLFEPK